MALDFNGSDDSISISASASLNAISTLFTVGAWINTPSIAQSVQMIVEKIGGLSWQLDFLFYIRTNDEIAVYTEESGVLSTSGVNIAINTWYWVVTTFDGTDLKIFVNGIEKASKTSAVDISTYVNSWKVAEKHDAGQYFTGKISDVLIMNRALHINEIKNLLVRRWMPDSNTIVCFRFDEGALNLAPGGLDCADISGNGNHGTAFGSMTDSDYVDGPPIQWNQGD